MSSHLDFGLYSSSLTLGKVIRLNVHQRSKPNDLMPGDLLSPIVVSSSTSLFAKGRGTLLELCLNGSHLIVLQQEKINIIKRKDHGKPCIGHHLWKCGHARVELDWDN